MYQYKWNQTNVYSKHYRLNTLHVVISAEYYKGEIYEIIKQSVCNGITISLVATTVKTATGCTTASESFVNWKLTMRRITFHHFINDSSVVWSIMICVF
jgi:hypothetical protein